MLHPLVYESISINISFNLLSRVYIILNIPTELNFILCKYNFILIQMVILNVNL